jgi:hypothetical protein
MRSVVVVARDMVNLRGGRRRFRWTALPLVVRYPRSGPVERCERTRVGGSRSSAGVTDWASVVDKPYIKLATVSTFTVVSTAWFPIRPDRR